MLLPEVFARVANLLRDRHGLQDHEAFLLISVREQRLYQVVQQQVVQQFLVSTSRYGTGCQVNSYRTPLGAHRIAEMLGDGCCLGEIFKARVPTGVVASAVGARELGEDMITTRILWLQGLEPGVNQGEGVDSYNRYIYIHGTHREDLIGQPASIGCVRMRNADVVDLYTRVFVGMLVYIAE